MEENGFSVGKKCCFPVCRRACVCEEVDYRFIMSEGFNITILLNYKQMSISKGNICLLFLPELTGCFFFFSRAVGQLKGSTHTLHRTGVTTVDEQYLLLPC